MLEWELQGVEDAASDAAPVKIPKVGRLKPQTSEILTLVVVFGGGG